MLPDERWSVYIAEDELYEFRLQLLRDRRTDQLVGFSNEGGDLARDYERLMELLIEHPVPGRYDAPDLGLTDGHAVRDHRRHLRALRRQARRESRVCLPRR